MGDITELLQRGAAGDEEAMRLLVEQVYPQLRRIARNLLRARNPPSLEVTEVVHEVYLKLVDQRRSTWQNRTQFYSVAARLMRRILVDHCRHRGRRKRGGDALRVVFDETLGLSSQPPHPDLLALDSALDRLGEIDGTVARLVELRYFGGLTVDEAALALGIGRTTAIRGWQYARSWLQRALTTVPG